MEFSPLLDVLSKTFKGTVSALLCATEGSSSQNQQQLIPQLLEATSLSEARDEKMGLKKASPQSAEPSTQHTCNPLKSPSYWVGWGEQKR
ncbi:hypothetical protein EK904_004825 [Melospiza melodia maxima]|nr:hypothetical protein EK904_004825 [Melospiza melodia maxima]